MASVAGYLLINQEITHMAMLIRREGKFSTIYSIIDENAEATIY